MGMNFTQKNFGYTKYIYCVLLGFHVVSKVLDIDRFDRMFRCYAYGIRSTVGYVKCQTIVIISNLRKKRTLCYKLGSKEISINCMWCKRNRQWQIFFWSVFSFTRLEALFVSKIWTILHYAKYASTILLLHIWEVQSIQKIIRIENLKLADYAPIKHI